MPITEEKLAEIRAANPGAELHLLSNDDTGVEVVVKAPNDGEWKRFRTMQSDEGQRPLAIRTLVTACVVYPPAGEFMGVLAARPGLAETFGKDLVEIAGVSSATRRRKL